MHAIVSLLDETHDKKVKQLWQALEKRCGLAGVHATPIPHFSWQLAAAYKWNELEKALAQVANRMPSFNIRVGGIGIFSGSRPVIYLPVVRDPQINTFHNYVWEEAKPYSIGIASQYDAPNWMPHITLAHEGLGPDKLNCAIEYLTPQNLNWQVKINNLALIEQDEGQTGTLRVRIPLKG